MLVAAVFIQKLYRKRISLYLSDQANRFATAAQIAANAAIFGGVWSQENLVPILVNFVMDESVSSRTELAGTLLELAAPLGAPPAPAPPPSLGAVVLLVAAAAGTAAPMVESAAAA